MGTTLDSFDSPTEGAGNTPKSEKRVIREEMPSSGARRCVEHKWVVAGKADDGEQVILACTRPGCAVTTLSTPAPQESTKIQEKRLLME